MITSPAFAGKRFAVLGLARSGAAAAEALIASGAEVIGWDRQDIAREPFEGRCRLIDPLELDLTGFAGVVVSPGVPLNSHPIGPHTWQYALPVIGDIELFAQARAHLPPHKVVGITGTNGKSTTTALVHHILQTARVPSVMGGNIGDPILGQDPLPEGGVYVLELSSFQIDLTFTLDCDVAALTNITPDHLDRHAGERHHAGVRRG
jgi:UDP-N-acetylmuramoylalanine--D-glutamate ligase